MDIYCLRVRKEDAGKKFPFDRVYLARNGEHKVFKELFRYALVLPVEEELKQILTDHVVIENFVEHDFRRVRDDEKNGKAHSRHEDWSVTLDRSDWVMCVPVLAKYVKENMPRYITAAGQYREPKEENVEDTGGGSLLAAATRKRVARRFARRLSGQKGEIKEPFPNLTYLQTPDKNIRPVCVACPRFILHQTGHCRLGEPICYTSLALGVHNQFQEGLDTPEAVDERELIEDGET